MRAILFDCDGTLADSFGIIVATMMETFRESDLPLPSPGDVRAIIGLSLDTAISRLVPVADQAEVSRLVDLYRSTFHRMRNDPSLEEGLFAGAEPMLRELAARDDVRLGMVTGKSRRGVRIIVETHALDGIFAAARTADDCPSKPHPAMVLECCAEIGANPDETLVVGDSIYDVQMAVAAGARAVGVTWGAADGDALRGAGAGYVADTMDGLRAEIARWLSEPSGLEEAVAP